MSKWCCICDKRGHNTAECWYKKNFLKEINREGGKWKKIHPANNKHPK